MLGPIGRNFGAGMTGGVAYVLDGEGRLSPRAHPDVDLQTLTRAEGRQLRLLIEAHRRATGSHRARKILEDFHSLLPLFRKVRPRSPAIRTLEGTRPAAASSAGGLHQAAALHP